MKTQTNLTKIKSQFLEYATRWEIAILNGDHRTANRLNKLLTNIQNKLRKDPGSVRELLLPLLKHSNPAVRLFSSLDILEIENENKEAETVLCELAKNQNIGLIHSISQISLSNWKKSKDDNSY